MDLNTKLEFSSIERQKILLADIVVISGGETLLLWKLLKKTRMISALQKFVQKENFILGGYSAGAIILTPTLRIIHFFGNDDFEDNIEQFEALNFVNFEILPHFSEERHAVKLEEYKKLIKYPIKVISDSGYILVEK